jgi:hypothetical protein
MPKVVINKCYGGFSLSPAAVARMAELQGRPQHAISSHPENRADPLLVRVVEELGEKASGECAKLKIVEIPDGIAWEIEEYDGMEHVVQKHERWW